MTITAGTQLGRYQIVSKLGEGGMGEVYLAEDPRLHRKLALKILPADLASNKDRMRRFEQEATAAAALNHPNIAHIYEIGEADGIHFIAMEFVAGQTLREKIHRERTELTKLLRYLQHAAEGLAQAHAAGIVHRDLKPDNIMVSREGHAKILDFGLAKLIEPQAPLAGDSSEVATAMIPQHSSPGTVMGTVGYMSPEQAQGKTKEIDQRSDVFSFGCILFEACTAKKAFEGESVIKSLHMVIYEPAPVLTELNPAAPPELQRIVRRCLEKDPDDRYQSIREVAIELKHVRRELGTGADFDTTVSPTVSAQSVLSTDSGSKVGPTASASIPPSLSSAEYVVQGIKRHKLAALISIAILVGAVGLVAYYRSARDTATSIDSIAVLPFENRSNAADSDYLADGLAESLIYRLSQLPNLKVSPTSSVMRYKGKETDVKKIASELGVSAVMTGRIAQRGDNLTISVELVDTRNNKVLWGEQYDRKMSDLLATQREIASRIVEKLQLKLAGTDNTGITKRYTDSNDAYQLYLRGRYSLAKRTKVEMLRAIEYYQEAVKLDPKFALAYARISETYGSMPAYPYLSPKEAFPKAKAAAQRALELDPTLAEAHTFLAYSLVIYDWNWTEAEQSFKRAIELDPNNVSAHFRYGQIYLAPVGRLDEALAEMKRGFDEEPLDINMAGTLAWAYFISGQSDKSLEQARKTYETEPNHPLGRWIICMIYSATGNPNQAIPLAEEWLRTDPINQFALREAGIAYAKAGRRDKAEEMIRRLREVAKTEYVPTARYAAVYAALGDIDKAFEELNTGFEEKDWELFRFNVDTYWIPLRGDPRFAALVKRLNLPEKN